ncbi:hypothetical protein F4808DRAFT_342104 [Astrocystis sublimbata]|nr:hypothetical protein F4808DRAFT_342104 [Astrocystis sublimbata]
MKTNVVNISPLEVWADIEQTSTAKARGDYSTTARFNTSFHTEREAPHLPSRPSEKPYSFKRWLPLILRSRGLASSDAQVVTLSRAQTRLLLKTADATIPSGSAAINRLYREDIDEKIVPAFDSLTFPADGLFMRLDACSAKDGVRKRPWVLALHSVEEALLLLLTSQRASNAMFHVLDSGDKEMDIFFLSWNHRMQSDREYRVFCPPFHSPDSLRISAISQYRWHREWFFNLAPVEEKEEAVEKIAKGVAAIAKQIAAEVDGEEEMDMLLMRQGLTFDVFFDHEYDLVQLVELNTFGARSACGSCVFHWIRDRKVLEGGDEHADVEFRLSYVWPRWKPSDSSADDDEDEECDDEEIEQVIEGIDGVAVVPG